MNFLMQFLVFPESPLRLLAVFLAAYLFLLLFTYLFQYRLLYFPDNSTPDSAGQFGLRPWPANNNFLGFAAEKTLHDPKGVFLVWHGNGGSALHRTYFVEALERRGYRVILMEYPGYCGKPGKLGESSFVSDALAAVDSARREFQCPIYLLGESLGCGVAAAVAGKRDWIKGVMLITPWAALPDLAQEKYWYLPVRWFIRDQYDNIANLENYNRPVAVLLAGNDEIVPIKHGQRLFHSIKSAKRLWVFPGSGHNTWPSGADEAWWDEAVEFLSMK